MSLGYVPYPNPDKSSAFHQDGAGITMECSYQDYSLSCLAKKLNKDQDYRYFYKRSMSYRNLFDKKTGWIRPKNVNGEWKVNFDPYEYKNGFVESNSAQMTWFVPHDIEGLSELMGGRNIAVERLNNQFLEAMKLNFTSGTSHSVELHPEYSRIPINYGNQPSIHTAFIFNKLGRPDLAQHWSSIIIEKAFSGLGSNKGYNGDEDQGIMGALAVLMKIGLFQLDGGVSLKPDYQIGSPIFDKITIHLDNRYYKGEKINIIVKDKVSTKRTLENAFWNGKSLENFSLYHSDLIKGGNLLLTK